jgi:hypothetical protein
VGRGEARPAEGRGVVLMDKRTRKVEGGLGRRAQGEWWENDKSQILRSNGELMVMLVRKSFADGASLRKQGR